MPVFRSKLLAFVVSCSVAGAAALVPVPGLKIVLPMAGLEPNGGQAKAEVLFVSRGNAALAVTAQSVWYSPLGARLNFVASNPNPAVRFADPLPGVMNSFTGADAPKWVTGASRYATANLAGIYPGIDLQYAIGADRELTLRMLLRAGVDVTPLIFEIPQAVTMTRNPDGSLGVRLGPSRLDPLLLYPQAVAFQEGPSGRVSRNVSYATQSTTRFGLEIQGLDHTLPLQIEIKLTETVLGPFTGANQISDTAGNTFVAATVPDAAGKDAPFPGQTAEGCATTNIVVPTACTDVAVYKFSKAGELLFVSYLAGRTQESASFIGLAADGALVVAGTTDSADFPVTAAALQPTYGGPAASPNRSGGDFFAARFDAATGLLRAATFLGGPNADSVGETVLGPDGSLYFMPKWIGTFSAGMPVTPGALQASCVGDPCLNGYVAHLSPLLDRLLFGTYLPGWVQATAKLHSDGSVYYAGTAGPGFPTSPTAYQRQSAGNDDGLVARLDPTGGRLLFATYLGSADTDWILRIAVAPDGSVWAAESSFVQCCVDIRNRLVRLDAKGERLLVDKPLDASDLAMDPDGNLIATMAGNFTVGPDAFLANACAYEYVAYVKLSPAGDQLFATYLPASTENDFVGRSGRGLPILRIGGEQFEVAEGQSMGVYAGCLVDAASFGNPDRLSPGAIVTLFGSELGPREPAVFQLVDGRVPVSLGGTQVLVNGEPAPILLSSYWQLNVILPYSLPVGTRPSIQVVSNGNPGNPLGGFFVQQAGISLFRASGSPNGPAAALNEDGSVNSTGNPARKGSRVVLFGTGGGPTVPPSVAGEVTPLLPRPLAYGAQVQLAGGPSVTVEYSGAAPGLVAGATQINIKLPDVIPAVTGFPPGTVPLLVNTPGTTFYSGYVTVAVKPD